MLVWSPHISNIFVRNIFFCSASFGRKLIYRVRCLPAVTIHLNMVASAYSFQIDRELNK